MSFVIHPFIKKYVPLTVHTKRYTADTLQQPLVPSNEV